MNGRSDFSGVLQLSAIRAILQEIGKRGLLKTSGMQLPIHVFIRDSRRDRREAWPYIPLEYDVLIP